MLLEHFRKVSFSPWVFEVLDIIEFIEHTLKRVRPEHIGFFHFYLDVRQELKSNELYKELPVEILLRAYSHAAHAEAVLQVFEALFDEITGLIDLDCLLCT